MWDVRAISAISEFSNCVWLQACESGNRPFFRLPLNGNANIARPGLSSITASMGSSAILDFTKAWVAFDVLPAAPFNLTMAERLALYAEMWTHVPVWAKDVRKAAQLPDALSGSQIVGGHPGYVSDEDLQFHVGEISLCLLEEWIQELQACQYLPFQMRDVPLLSLAYDGYIVDNSLLKSELAGLAVRNSKNIDDRGKRIIDFGSTVDGIVEQSEDGMQWLKIKGSTNVRALADFRHAWSRTAEALLTDLILRWRSRQADPRASRLIEVATHVQERAKELRSMVSAKELHLRH